MRYLLERALLIVGLTVVGTVTTGLGLAFLAAWTVLQPRPGEEPGTAWGGALVFLGCLVCGGVLGALVGATVAIRRIAQFPDRNWSPLTWSGVSFGLLIGVAIGLTGMGGRTFLHDLFAPFDGTWKAWLSAAVVMTMGGTVGGIIATLCQRGREPAKWKRQVGTRR